MIEENEKSLPEQNVLTIEDELKKRKEKVFDFLKKGENWIYYLILAFITFIGVYIRTRNISGLKDVTTGTWTLGPDLDPFLFLRWANYVIEHGSLMTVDMMRSVPLGHSTAADMKLLPYLIAWFHKSLLTFSLTDSITYSAILFPVMMFALTSVAFFLFARKIFYRQNNKIKNIIALIATSFFVLIPSILPRTIAGIPEKESAAFFFIFMAFYLFLEAFTTEKIRNGLIFGILAGVFTGAMALIWGGVGFVFMTIAGATFFVFLLGKIDKNKIYIFSSWIIGFIISSMPFSARYSPMNLIASTSTGIIFFVLLVLLTDHFIFKKKVFNLGEKISRKVKLPSPIISLLVVVIIIWVLSIIFFGFSFIPDKISDIVGQTVHPLDVSRFGLTVAENKQPYFVNDWKNSFGPIIFNIPLFFWLFFIGSVFLFNNLIKKLDKRERIILTFGYLIFLICLIFSKYSPSHILDGITTLSLFVYFGGMLLFIGIFGYVYLKRYRKGSFFIFREFNMTYVLYFIILTMGIIGARGAVRLIMVLGAISPVAVAFLIVKTSQKYFIKKEEMIKFFILIMALILIIASVFTLWTYYQTDISQAESFSPGPYQWQWQKAMAWVRENTSQDAVFAHWWDYGYWIQSIGERATILDGGNAIVYWNYLMGRHVLTGTDENTALEFLYTHNGTHLLIDSTDIGKYTAFSSIGSDEDYDRFSWISTFLMDERQTQETKNETIYIYQGGSVIDEDIVWEIDGKQIFLPRKSAGVGAIILKKNGEKILQPEGIFIYNGQQYKIPLRFMYFDKKINDFGSGLDAGIFLFPSINNAPNGGIEINQIGAILYLSKRTVHALLVRLYLFGEETDNFKVVHSQDSYLVENLKAGGMDMGEIIYYQGVQGPIKIWEVSYPKGIKLNPDYLQKYYPNEDIRVAKIGEY